MKKSIFKKALLGFAAIVGFAFTVQPTIVANLLGGVVTPGYRFTFMLTYTNTDIMRMRVVQFPDEVDLIVPIPDETRNLSSESTWYISDIIHEPNTTRAYQFVVQGPPDSNGNVLTDHAGVVITTDNVQP